MRLTSATCYALRALVYLAGHDGQGAVPSHALTGACTGATCSRR
jgi:DNA-binding IscR family transcriptional regulator